MKTFNTTNSYRTERAMRKISSKDEKKSPFRKWRFLAIATIIFTISMIIYAICFAYKPTIVPQLLSRNKEATLKVVAPFNFAYISDVQTLETKERNAQRVPPIYKTNVEVIKNESLNYTNLAQLLNSAQEKYQQETDESKDYDSFVENLSTEINKSHKLTISPDDIKLILEKTNFENRLPIFRQAFFYVSNILRKGIYADDDAIFENLNLPQAEVANVTFNLNAQSESNARRELLVDIKTLGENQYLSLAIFRMMAQSLRPNIIYDEQQTKLSREKARDLVKPVLVKVRAGETLMDSDTAPTALTTERIRAYKKELQKRDINFSFSMGSVEFMFTILVVIAGALFISISKTARNRQPKTVAIFSTLLLLNLSIERFFIEITNGQTLDSKTTMLQAFVYVVPLMIAPIVQVLLFGSYTGFIMALMISALTTYMMAEGVLYFVIFLSSSLLAIYFCSSATTKTRVVFTGVIYGAFVGFLSFILGSLMSLESNLIWLQSISSVIFGVLIGVLSLMVLIIIERIFKCSSNITLADYIDFNNPLLRRLQIESPGTYHHSVMVSYLAEAAANAINVNTMVCKVGALYHDIGKLQKPEYFSENQSDGKNPHDNQTPSMSALIIKNHVKDGMEIGRLQKLPKQILDAIIQHHGTTLVSYFFFKAKKQAEEENKSPDIVEESTYRHEGIRPKTIENAIIMIADSCEAASRSLKRITQHSIEDLVDNIVQAKIADNQLDDCPITVNQLSKIKKSIVFTMLNMLHTRISYNNDKK